MRLLYSVLLCTTLLIMTVLPQALIASHANLSQLQIEANGEGHHHHDEHSALLHQQLLSEQQIITQFDIDHDHSAFGVDHSHESVDVFQLAALKIDNISNLHLIDQYACLDLCIPVPEDPPRI